MTDPTRSPGDGDRGTDADGGGAGECDDDPGDRRDPFVDPAPVPDSFDPDADPVNRAAVDRRLDRLRSEYGREEAVVEESRTAAGNYRRLYGAAMAGYLGGAYVWTVRPAASMPEPSTSMPSGSAATDDRVLLLLERGSSRWTIPGGGREPPESYEAAATREVREETGIDAEVTGLYGCQRLVVDPGLGDGPAAPPIHVLNVVFEGRYRGGEIAVQASEGYGAAWFATPPDRVHPLAERRVEEWREDGEP